MKSLGHFITRLRTTHNKELKKIKTKEDALNGPCANLYYFLAEVINYCEMNLYQDKPIEGAFPLFDILKTLQEFFGGI